MLFIVSLIAAFVYLLMVNRDPSLTRTLAKALSFGVLLIFPVVLAFEAPSTANLNLLFFTLGLLACVLGDIYLSLPETPARFTKGLASFLLGHVCYAIFMWPHVELHGTPRAYLLTYGLALILLAGLVMILLWPRLGQMRLPVLAYMIVILAMALLASLVPGAGYVIAAGAMLFILSDAMIALNRFRVSIPLAGPLIWITYYAGHLGMVAGFLDLLGVLQV